MQECMAGIEWRHDRQLCSMAFDISEMMPVDLHNTDLHNTTSN